MKQNFGDRVSVATITEPEPAAAEEDEKPEEGERKEFEFNLLQTGGSEEGPSDCGLRSLQPRQLPPAAGERGSGPRAGN